MSALTQPTLNFIEWNKFIQFIFNQLKTVCVPFHPEKKPPVQFNWNCPLRFQNEIRTMCCKHVPQFVCILRHISLHIYRYNLNVNDCIAIHGSATTVKHKTIKLESQCSLSLSMRWKRKNQNQKWPKWRDYKLRQNNLSCVSAKIHNKTNVFFSSFSVRMITNEKNNEIFFCVG